VDTDRFLTDHAHLLGNKGWHEIASHSKGVEINSSTSLQSYWLVLPLDINTKSVVTTRSVMRSLDILSGGAIMTVLVHVVMEVGECKLYLCYSLNVISGGKSLRNLRNLISFFSASQLTISSKSHVM